MLPPLSMAEVDAGIAIAQQKSRSWAPFPPTSDHLQSHYHYHALYDNEAYEANKEWISREGGQRRSLYRHNVHALRSRLSADPPLQPQNSCLWRHRHQHMPKIEAFNHHNAYGYGGGGPGMQAFFINSCPRPSSGTGVFLPQRPDICKLESSNKKHACACAPVLLPTRVVQALNLNVHAVGHQISPRQDVKRQMMPRDDHSNEGVDSENNASQGCVVSHNRSFSPHIFLPKEWTY
ncbi:hypothetical protein SAY86_005906 [Trapa natans]|uniref:Uncharacterized protein n=1 Tax=Trapa natans TaxID=22666 RepID=A0AAN7L6F0_TRANT|nr:hypothetical protein SAY86_005906 [Trapa natans]